MKRSISLLILLFPFLISAQSGTWGVTYLPQPSAYLSSATSLSKAFFLERTSRKLYIYDEPTGSLSTDSVPTALHTYAIGALGSKVFVCCDSTNQAVSKKVYVFDQLTGNWSVTQLSEARGGVTMCSNGSKIYFIGGYILGGGPMGSTSYYGKTTIDIYDSISNSWSIKNLPQSRFWHNVYAQNNKIFISGGESNQFLLDYHETIIYDILFDTWTTKPVITPGGCFGGIGDVAMYCYGSTAQPPSSVPSTTYEKYNFTGDLWTTGAFHYSRNFASAISGSDRVFFGNDKYLDVYYAPADSFYIDSLPLQRTYMCLASVNGKVLFAGGTLINSQPTNHVDIFYDSTASISLKENFTQKQLNIFPNPCSSLVNIENKENNDKVEVFDMLGKEIKSIKNINSKVILIDISDLKQGIYQFKISSGNKVEFRKVNVINSN